VKNLKPSQLSEGTVIDDPRYGEYIKRADGIWEEMDRDQIGDRDRVTDEGYDNAGEETFAQFLSRTGLAHSDKSDNYFKDYKVISLPVSVVASLVDTVYGWQTHHARGNNLVNPGQSEILIHAIHESETYRDEQ